ncbi:VOC family protein [Saccharopolyspora indica]|uniref:VOC family protein n=1 Tax=Saccharopolyspora indica TaxID=1229659 RepID=UPI0022EB1EF6|nr:VOC family protein [Saccharopolyspora indica]MDA3646131.1 VOC family protein [Saccharopolyspora indica]
MTRDLVTWLQIPADDVERAWEFYGEVFGWSAEAAYANEPRSGAIYGEIAPRSDDLRTPRPVIRVADVEVALRRVEAAGGAVVTGRTEIPEIAMVYAVFADPEGNLINVVGDMPSEGDS